MCPFTSKKDKFLELEERLGAEIKEVRESLSAKLEEKLMRVNEELGRALEILSTVASQPEKWESQISSFMERAEKVAEELTIVRYYENMLLSVQEGIKDIISALSRERESIKQEVNKLLKEKTELAMMREELRKWREELEEKEKSLSLREAEIRELEERRRALENKIAELSQRYLAGLEEAKSKLEDMMKEMLRDFKLREIRLERLVRREAELKDSLAKLREREEEAARLERRLTQLKGELTALSERKKRLESEVRDLEEKRASLEKILGDMRRAFLSP